MIKQLVLLILLLNSALFGKNLNPMLLQIYKGDENLTGWVISEKFDGVRAIWDGANLRSRNGKIINAPKFWTENFPPFAIDGELWTKREDFENLYSIVADSKPGDEWKSVKFLIFDVPSVKGNLFSRLANLREFLDKNEVKNIEIIEQIPINSHKEVKKFLNSVLAKGGEGAVIRDPNSPYINGRSDKILKVKKFLDSECEVLQIYDGKGKFKGKMGSLLCRDIKSGVEFRLGSGFGDEIRSNPPKIGQILTYKFQNLTKNGKPRFPVFIRFKKEL